MKLDSPTYNTIHKIDILDFAHTYFYDKANELAKSSLPEDIKMAKLWFVVASELEKDIDKYYNNLCTHIHEIKTLETQEEGKDGILTEHSGS